jgi:D-alanine--poly(phosphoribitol) ligase subunit 1
VDSSAQGLVAFVVGRPVDEAVSGAEIAGRMGAHLPRYMVPSAIRFVDALPQNINGKIDRKALFAKAEAEAKASTLQPA